jgi:putative FmdB family regulatory protein
MPIFEYRCGDCDHEFELLVLKTLGAPRCPECGSGKVEKLLSLPAVSSEQTKKRASRAQRARNASTRRDHAEAEAARIRAHDDE